MASVFWNASDLSNADTSGRKAEPAFTSDADILLSNLALLKHEEDTLNKRRSAQISELASLFTAEKTHLRDAIADFSEKHFMKNGACAGNTEILLLCKALARRGFSFFSTEHSPVETAPLFGSATPTAAKASERIAYLHNRYSDAAFLKLTSQLGKPHAAYFSSFSDVCEEVYHGLCEFCILPVESSTDGKLLRFYALIEKYDLKIVSVCDVEDPNGGYTGYALLRHKYVTLPSQRKAGGRYFAEFSLISDGRFSLSDILNAARLCRMQLLRVDSIPLSYSEGKYRYNPVFSLPDFTNETAYDIEAFGLYLSVTLPEYIPIGIYSQIS